MWFAAAAGNPAACGGAIGREADQGWPGDLV